MVIKEDLEKVRILRLANPPSNVLGLSLLATLKHEVEEAAGSPSVRCLVLASSYPRYFCSGLDLQELTSLPPERRSEHFAALLEVHQALRDLPKPTLACIGGAALLGGWILALACDFRFMSRENGKISLSEIRFGLSPTSAIIERVKSVSSSPTLVKELLLRGKTLRAEDALAGGFVDRLCPAETLEQESLHEAKLLTKQALPAYAAIKKALYRRPPGDEAALLQESRDDFESLMATSEAQEGVLAMRDKRRPRWED